MIFLRLFVLLTTLNGALLASIASPVSNGTISAAGPNPRQQLKTYHVPDTSTTLIFFAYTAPRSLTPAVSYQALVTALKSIYHSTAFNHGDTYIHSGTISWSYSGASVTIENHGIDRTGMLTWGTLVDTMYGVGAFLEGQTCWSGEWMIEVEGLGNIGSGSIGPKVGGKVGGKVDGTVAEVAAETA